MPMRYLLDTHTFLWFVLNDNRLSPVARALISDPAHDLFLSMASIWEMGIKSSIGKLQLGSPFELFIPTQLAGNDIDVLAIGYSHVARVTQLPFHHRDPFDRMLAAQALVEGMPLISADAVFDLYGVNRLY